MAGTDKRAPAKLVKELFTVRRQAVLDKDCRVCQQAELHKAFSRHSRWPVAGARWAVVHRQLTCPHPLRNRCVVEASMVVNASRRCPRSALFEQARYTDASDRGPVGGEHAVGKIHAQKLWLGPIGSVPSLPAELTSGA